MPDYETFEHDVLVIGAGGAGLRAAIEASAAGVSVGLVCKSLLGKAHTVMAEGGIAAALANVDERERTFTPVAFARLTNGACRRISPERFIVRAAIVVTGQPESARCPKDQQRRRKN